MKIKVVIIMVTVVILMGSNIVQSSPEQSGGDCWDTIWRDCANQSGGDYDGGCCWVIPNEVYNQRDCLCSFTTHASRYKKESINSILVSCNRSLSLDTLCNATNTTVYTTVLRSPPSTIRLQGRMMINDSDYSDYTPDYTPDYSTPDYTPDSTPDYTPDYSDYTPDYSNYTPDSTPDYTPDYSYYDYYDYAPPEPQGTDLKVIVPAVVVPVLGIVAAVLRILWYYKRKRNKNPHPPPHSLQVIVNNPGYSTDGAVKAEANTAAAETAQWNRRSDDGSEHGRATKAEVKTNTTAAKAKTNTSAGAREDGAPAGGAAEVADAVELT